MFAPRNCTPGTTGPPGTGATSLPTTLPPSTSSADSRPTLERSTAKPPFSTVSDPDCSGSLALAATARKIPTSTATASVATLKRFSTTIRTPLPCCRVEQRRRRLQPKPLATGAKSSVARDPTRAEARVQPGGSISEVLVRPADAVVDESVLECIPRRLGAIRDAELPVDVRQVELHRLLGDPELLRDSLVR